MALRNLIILPEAEQDAAQAYLWYEDQELGLAKSSFVVSMLVFSSSGEVQGYIR